MRCQPIYRSLLAAGMFFSGSSLYASAFQLFEQDAASLGDYHAGYAVNTDDSASAAFYNPAALTTLKKQQVTAGAVTIDTSMRFKGTVYDISSGNDEYGAGNGGVFKIVPNGYYALPLLNDRLTLGFGVAVPYGLATDYSRSSVVSNYATKTDMEEVDLIPALGFKVNSYLSLGAGLDINRLSATFNNLVADEFNDDTSGHSWGYGWHAGLLITPDTLTRVGLTYHSRVIQHLKGSSHVYDEDNSDNEIDSTNNVRANVTMPAWTALSASRILSPKWTLMSSVMYTDWSVFKNLTLQNLPTLGGVSPSVVTVPQNFNSTWNFAVGVHYQVQPNLMLRVGGGYDTTPTNNKDRNLRMPDNDRYAFALGAQYNWHQRVKLDIGWMHLFIDHTSIDNNPQNYSTPGASVLSRSKGSVNSFANLYGAQITYNFG